ncbi:MAG: hypothetical protein ACXWNC_04400 [Anaerolineales bacterium]
MDNFDLKPEPKKFNLKSLIWNVLTVLAVLGVCVVSLFLLTIFINPDTPLNPFPPAALPTLYKTNTPTATIVLIHREATWTPTETLTPVPTRTTAPTWTLLPQLVTQSITPVPSESIPAGTDTSMPATAQITYVASTGIHPDLGCKWFGVGGKVLGTDGKPVLFMEIQLGGTLNGKTINYVILSGNATAYGPSGFEQVLSDHPIATTQALWVQLLDNTAKPLTNKIYFDTYSTCTQNLVMVVFTRNR